MVEEKKIYKRREKKEKKKKCLRLVQPFAFSYFIFYPSYFPSRFYSPLISALYSVYTCTFDGILLLLLNKLKFFFRFVDIQAIYIVRVFFICIYFFFIIIFFRILGIYFLSPRSFRDSSNILHYKI